jgi:hypothetical protein
VHECGTVEGFGCRPATAARHTPVAGVRKPPRKEPAGDGARRMPRTPLWGLYERGHCQALSSFAFALSFVRPRRRLSSAPTVDFRRRRAQKLSKSAVALAIEAHFDVSRPRLDSFEHGGRLDDRGPKERSVVEFLPLLSLFASGPCRLRVQRRCPMARAMIASAYIRQPPFRLATLLHAWTIAQVGRGSSLTR